MKKTNKLISILLVLAMLLSVAPLTAFAATEALALKKNSYTMAAYSGSATQYILDGNYLYKVAYSNLKGVSKVGISYKSTYELCLHYEKSDTGDTAYTVLHKGKTDIAYLGDLPKTPGSKISLLTTFDQIYINKDKPVVIFTCIAVNAPAWTWDGTSSATAKFTSTDGNAFVNMTATISQETVTEATTCQMKEQIKYTASVTFNGQTYTNTKTVTGAAGPHSYINGKCEHCGYECPHNSFTDGKCNVCGVQHTHDYIYTASGNVITATCSNADGVCSDTNGGTLTISAPAELYTDGTISREAVIDNQLVEATDYTVSYSTADGSAPKTAGTYTASVTLGGATASVEFTLSDYAAKVTDKDGNLIDSYKTIEDAISAASDNNGSTLVLLDDITVTKEQEIKSGKFTLDLNGKTLLNEIGGVLYIWSDADLTIEDSSEGGTIESQHDACYSIFNEGKLTVESGIVKGDGGIDNRGTLIFNGGTVESVTYEAISNGGTAGIYGGNLKSEKSAGIENKDLATFNIYGGKIDGITNFGTAYISGGEIDCDNYAALNLFEGTVEIMGGSFSGTDLDNGYFSGTPYGEWTVDYTEGATLTLKGGEFPGGFTVYGTTANVFLADGYYFRDADGKIITVAENATGIDGYVKVTKGADFSADAVVNVDNVVYNGAAQEPTVTVKVGGKTLTEGKDYTLVFANNVNAGTATVTVKAVGQVAGGIVGGGNSNAGNSVESVYTGEITKEFTILKADSAVETAPTANEITYNGEAQALVTAGSSENGAVVYSLDGAEYSEEIPTGINAGKYTVYYKVIGDSNHNDTEPETVTVTIGKKSVTVSATVPDRIYGDDYRVDTSKVVVTFDGIVDGDDVGYAVIDAYYHVHTVTDNALVQVVYNVNGEDAGNYQFPEYGDWLAPNYPVRATGKVLPRDIADAQITLGDALTYNGAEQTQSIASVTVIGKDVTYTVSGNTATNVGVYELTITSNGNFTGTKNVTFEIAPDTSAIDAITVDNVKSSDKEVIEAVANQLENAATDFADDAKKEEYKTITDKCNELLGTIAETEEKLEEIKGIESNYNPENVSSDDKAAIENKIAEIEAVNPDNLTEEQKAEYAEIKAGFEALIEEIEKAGSEVDAIGAEFEMFDEERVTIFYEDEIEALKAKIDELLADENMGESEKAKLNEYKAQCDNLIEIINTPAKYFSIRLFHFVWDALHWLSSHVVFIFNWIVAMF